MSEHKINKVIIVGAGGIGRAVGLLLAEYADFEISLFLGDRDLLIAGEAASWMNEGNTKGIYATAFQLLPGYEDQENNQFIQADIILDCLPGTEAPRMGAIAKRYGAHYVNLTEYVNETEQIKKLSEDAETGFILQSGLAPGFVNILAHSLYKKFVFKYKNEQVEYIGMKVGALTEHAEAPHFYGFTWSPVGVATEYLKDAWIVDDFKKKTVPSLSGRGSLIINGISYEEDYTSGGAADLPDVFSKKTRKLDYKTLRYPGHFKWIQSILDQVPQNEEPIQYLEKHMLSVIPSIEEDIVVIYCVVKGFDHSSCLRSLEKAFKIGPVKVGKVTLRAIQSTTAAPMAECARMLLSGKYKGTILQSHIDPIEFLNGPFVKAVYFPDHAVHLLKESRNAVVRVAV
ncbi:saccharopine dehydrogenase C-terminal domain-containing protein [Arcticibacter eurypsychrophilus]|uniref:saccharopine dehydrogenase C-terminal domain-containing protein n=1 Tax=Arcticibacter eurypsychrophilus TaxID=1434752 RepID=UPI00084DF207|nr:saccharopine dehydrogenase C-terminal domain-containing protein [Arcticibacter eurypsychrophilus]